MDIRIHPYILQPWESAPRKGCLLEVTFKPDQKGYANLFTWPEVGDASLDEELEALRHHNPLKLGKRAIELAKIDASFRSKKQNALENAIIPASHYLVGNAQKLSDDKVAHALHRGFKIFKIKLGDHLQDELNHLKPLMENFASAGIRYRLDFNGKLNQTTFLHVVDELDFYLEAIEFFEDPFPASLLDEWDLGQKVGVQFAADRHIDPFIGDTKKAPYLVFKPALHSEVAIPSAQKIIVTNYVSHPFDQMVAAYFAAKLSTETAGLVHDHYMPSNPFFEALQVKHGTLVPAKGTGFGFDELLTQLDWIQL